MENIQINKFFFLFFFSGLSSVAFADSYTPPPSSSLSIVRVIFSLLIVFVIFYIIVFFLKFIFVRKGLIVNRKGLKLLNILHAGPNLSLYLVESGEKTLLIAANANHITLVQEREKMEEELTDTETGSIEPSFKDFLSKLGFKKGDKK
ncbi:MAG: flagellar biosynthetic protein FliO [Candidatus Eremiobacterota bacterium]